MTDRTFKEKIEEEMVIDEEKEAVVESVLKAIQEGGTMQFGDIATYSDEGIKHKIREKYDELEEKNGNESQFS